MREYQGKRQWQRRLYSWPVIVLLVILILWFGHAVWGVYQKSRITTANEASAKQELDQLLARKQQLEEQIHLLETERGLEGKIREKFSVVKPGEQVITIVPSSTSGATSTKNKSWWLRLWPF